MRFPGGKNTHSAVSGPLLLHEETAAAAAVVKPFDAHISNYHRVETLKHNFTPLLPTASNIISLS